MNDLNGKNYYGAYMGFSEEMGFTISVYKPDGTTAHFATLHTDEFFLITRGTHSANGDTLTTELHKLELFGVGKSAVIDKARIFWGEKLLYDNSGTYAEDYPEYFIAGYDPLFWDNIKFDDPITNEDGSVLPQIKAKLNQLAEPNKKNTKTKALQEKKASPQKAAQAADQKTDTQPELPPQKLPEPPYLMTYQPLEIITICGLPPMDGDKSTKKGKWRRKHGTDINVDDFIDEARDCSDFLENNGTDKDSGEAREGSVSNKNPINNRVPLKTWQNSIKYDIIKEKSGGTR